MRDLIRTILILQLAWLNACTPTKSKSAFEPPVESDALYATMELPADAEKETQSESAVAAAAPSKKSLHERKGDHSFARGKMMALNYAGGVGSGAMAIDADYNTESYDTITENDFHRTVRDPLSTFSIDVDTAAYANVRRMIQNRQQPLKDAVRVEELINYFDYADAPPTGSEPFAVHMEAAPALWNSKHQVVRIGLKGREIKREKRPASNLVFLIDTSGSMNFENKLPLVRESMKMLVKELGREDLVSIVVYAGAAGQVLAPTRGDQKKKIVDAIDNLEAGGSTNGGAGIELAYKLAEENFVKGGVNRVLLATDGDFNVGVTDRSGLIGLAEKKAKKNVYLSVLGYGMGNLKDGMMEELSRKANGNYAYIDSLNEAKKVLVEQMSGTLVTIAKDVKIQVEFNPKHIEAYRLVGYENRVMRNEDFNDDKKDAGDIGAGHTVTALYEIVPVGVKLEGGSVDALKYQKTEKIAAYEGAVGEWMNVKIRYKKPDGDVSAKIEKPFFFKKQELKEASEALRFASAVATFGMLIRDSQFLKEGDLLTVKSIAKAAMSRDPHGYRAEFITLVEQAAQLKTGEQASHED